VGRRAWPDRARPSPPCPPARRPATCSASAETSSPRTCSISSVRFTPPRLRRRRPARRPISSDARRRGVTGPPSARSPRRRPGPGAGRAGRCRHHRARSRSAPREAPGTQNRLTWQATLTLVWANRLLGPADLLRELGRSERNQPASLNRTVPAASAGVRASRPHAPAGRRSAPRRRRGRRRTRASASCRHLGRRSPHERRGRQIQSSGPGRSSARSGTRKSSASPRFIGPFGPAPRRVPPFSGGPRAGSARRRRPPSAVRGVHLPVTAVRFAPA
jgi:hypothetical protein